MPLSDALYLELAKAESQPSKAYRTVDEGLTGLATNADRLRGYLEENRKRKLEQQTLSQALGSSLPNELAPYGNVSNETWKSIAPGIEAVSKLNKPQKSDDWLAKFQMREDAIMKRQKDRQDFVRSMVGAKGNKDAVAEGQDALKASEAMQSLNDELDKLSPTMARLNSTAVAKITEPILAAKKAQILLYAGFSRGGKQLTGTELSVVVNALTPTGLDNKESRHMKNQTFQDWAQGKISLMDAAKLLGPAGAPLVGIAQDQRLKQESRNRSMAMGLAGGEGSDLDNIFNSVGGE